MGFQFMNNYRGIAILMVLLAHAISVLRSMKPVESEGILLLNLHMDNCTLIFVTVAGFFFSILSVNYSYIPFLKNKFKAVIVPYFIISIPMVILYILNLKQQHRWIDLEWFHSSLDPVSQYVFLMITGAHLGPLWFVPMIVIFYAVSPVFIVIKNNNVVVPAFLLSLALGAFLSRPALNDNALHSFAYFLPAFFLGMLLAEKKYLYESIMKYSEALLTLYIVIVSVLYMNIEINTSVDLFIKLSLAFIVMALCRKCMNYKIVWLDLFARLSFYLFFIHGYFTGVARITFRETSVELEEYFALIFVFIYIIFMSLAAYVVCKLFLKEQTKYFLGA